MVYREAPQVEWPTAKEMAEATTQARVEVTNQALHEVFGYIRLARDQGLYLVRLALCDSTSTAYSDGCLQCRCSKALAAGVHLIEHPLEDLGYHVQANSYTMTISWVGER